MTQDEIIAMAREAGINAHADTLCRYQGWVEPLEHFAKLVAVHVSRELAKECAGSGEWTAVHIIERVEW